MNSAERRGNKVTKQRNLLKRCRSCNSCKEYDAYKVQREMNSAERRGNEVTKQSTLLKRCHSCNSSKECEKIEKGNKHGSDGSDKTIR